MQTNWRNNEDSPCHNCPERFTACSSKCPKDKRGEYGYNAWREDMKEINKRHTEYIKCHNEDYKRSEAYEWKQRKRGNR